MKRTTMHGTSTPTARKIASGPTRLDSCDECGEKTSITILDRNSAETGEWVCNDCADVDGDGR